MTQSVSRGCGRGRHRRRPDNLGRTRQTSDLLWPLPGWSIPGESRSSLIEFGPAMIGRISSNSVEFGPTKSTNFGPNLGAEFGQMRPVLFKLFWIWQQLVDLCTDCGQTWANSARPGRNQPNLGRNRRHVGRRRQIIGRCVAKRDHFFASWPVYRFRPPIGLAQRGRSRQRIRSHAEELNHSERLAFEPEGSAPCDIYIGVDRGVERPEGRSEGRSEFHADIGSEGSDMDEYTPHRSFAFRNEGCATSWNAG